MEEVSWANWYSRTRDKIGSRACATAARGAGTVESTVPADAINFAIDELARDRSAMSLAAANREVWKAQPAGYY